MATIPGHEQLVRQTPFEQGWMITGQTPFERTWTVPSQGVPSEPGESGEREGYLSPDVALEPNAILPLVRPRRSGREHKATLFTAIGSLGSVGSRWVGMANVPQTATGVIPLHAGLPETRRLIAHTVAGIYVWAAQMQAQQSLARAIKAWEPRPTAAWQTAVTDILERTRHTEIREAVSPAAEEYAKSLGVYGSLILSKKLVWETFPNLRHLSIGREEDMEEGVHPVIRFTITTPDSVERVLELDDQLKSAFCRMTPPRHQPRFSFTYQFEA